jgi:hypothetical protein
VAERKAQEERERLEQERLIEQARLDEEQRLEEARRLQAELEAEAERQRLEDEAAEDAFRRLMEGVDVDFAEDEPAPIVPTTKKGGKRNTKSSPDVNEEVEIVEVANGSQRRPKPRLRKKAKNSPSTSQTLGESSQAAEGTSVKVRISSLFSSFLMKTPVRSMRVVQVRDDLCHQTGGQGMFEV